MASESTNPTAAQERPGERPLNVRMSEHLRGRVEKVADGLELDASNFVRLVLAQALPLYEAGKANPFLSSIRDCQEQS